MAGRKFGIDPGTMNLRICQIGRGLIVNEKNLVAIRKKTVIAAGDEAYEMYERTPASIKIERPVQGGIIADTDTLSKCAEMLLKKGNASSGFMRGNHFFIVVPSDITEVEKRAYFNLILESSFSTHHLYLVEKPVATAIGENLPLSGRDPVMIVDMGAGSTEISILMQNGIAVSTLLHEGGLTINETIRQAVKTEDQLLIGEKTSEFLKFELGSAVPDSRSGVTVYGRHIVTGLPSQAEVPVSIVFEAMKMYFVHVVQTIHNMIGKVPPQQAEYILQNGVFFTGGTSLIPKLPELFASILGLPVKFSQSPTDSAVKGLGKIIQDPAAYRDILISMHDAALD